LRDGALLLIDSAPIVYVLEGHPQLAARFDGLFERHAAGRLRFAVTTLALAEVLAGPAQRGDQALLERYRATLLSWNLVPLDAEIAASAARLRAAARLKLPDAVQAASAFAIGADALVTHDRDFSRLRGLRVLP
jgi:predicted nucleic acid-binding protein